MIRLVSYADANMSKSLELCYESAYKNGVNNAHVWDRQMLEETEFYDMNREILDQQRGSGYWLWKPYIIYKALLDMNENDILIYSDAGVEFINSVQHIILAMDEDVFLFGNNYNHADWCKQDVFDAIIPDISLHHSRQVQASVIFIKPTQKAKEFVKEWLLYCQMPNLIDDSKSKLPNYLTFVEHRHDQAILTCLQIKYEYKQHYWPAMYNNGAFVYDKLKDYKDSYPIIFHHHRKRNNEWQ